MIIRGILDRSLNGVSCIRGFAPLKDLVKISEAQEYQRIIDTEHKKEITEYIEKREYLFFPEVILSYKLSEKDNAKINSLLGLEIIKGKKGDVSFALSNKSYTSKSDSRFKEIINLVTIDINNISLESSKPFSRIDGNHRLSASENISDNSIQNFMAPFCIVLLNNDVKDIAFESAIFHNINSKAKHLTSEENLNVILNEEYFSDIDLKDKFGWEFYAIRKLFCELPSDNLSVAFPNLGSEFSNTPKTFCKELVELLIEVKAITKSNKSIDNITEALQKVNVTIGSKCLQSKLKSIGIIEAAVYFELTKKYSLDLFFNWILHNHIYEIEGLKAKSLIRIYEKLRETKNKEVFISMQFCPDTEPHYKAIQKAVQEINIEYKLDIKLKEIRIDKFEDGSSYDINEKIFQKIEESGLLIVDISKYNGNVYHELGYMMGLNKAKGLPQENFIIIKSNDKKFKNDKVGFNITSIKQLRFDDTLQLAGMIKESLKKYYNL